MTLHSCCSMRYLLDTNIFLYLATDKGLIEPNIYDLLNEPDAELYISAESVRELIVGYYNQSFSTRQWKTAEQMVRSIEDDFFIKILPLKKEHMLTYSRLRPYVAHGHKDPSDHVIISHAITEKLTLVSSDTRFPFYRRQGLELLFNEK